MLPVRDAEEKGLRMLKEFREFAMKSSVVGLTVGVIISAAFEIRDLLKNS
jgi:large conductance mechanosensitive channel